MGVGSVQCALPRALGDAVADTSFLVAFYRVECRVSCSVGRRRSDAHDLYGGRLQLYPVWGGFPFI